jgi:hypothetical protein
MAMRNAQEGYDEESIVRFIESVIDDVESLTAEAFIERHHDELKGHFGSAFPRKTLSMLSRKCRRILMTGKCY